MKQLVIWIGAIAIGVIGLGLLDFMTFGIIVDYTSRASGGAIVDVGAMSMRGSLPRGSYSGSFSSGRSRGGPWAEPKSRPAATTFYDNPRTGKMAGDRPSTFSFDVDRTSYQLALNWARSGYEIEPDSVRAEEWVNAFDYEYAPPVDGDKFAIYSDALEHPLEEGKLMARIAFQAPEIVDDDTPMNVTLVLDASGSMGEGNKIEIARAAAESVRASLREGDEIAIVHFTTEVVDELTVRHAAPVDPAVRESISKLRWRDSTNVQAGLDLGVELAQRAREDRPEAYNYIILMSDGVANVDAADPSAILESAADSDDGNPLRLIAIGVGIDNYNDYLLEQLAQHGDGWYRYLNDVDVARATFARDNWLALSTPFADQTRAQVRWDPDIVESWRILGYENRVTSEESFDEDRKEFAEIPSGAATTVFYEIELVDGIEELRPGATLGNVEARWVSPKSREAMSLNAPIVAGGEDAFDESEYALLRLGALVALAADRYGSPPEIGGAAAEYSLRDDLDALKRDLEDLQSDLGDRGAYKDFAFLLGHMALNAPGGEEADRDTGYSR